jgi:hypothetical protein
MNRLNISNIIEATFTRANKRMLPNWFYSALKTSRKCGRWASKKDQGALRSRNLTKLVGIVEPMRTLELDV